MTSLVNLPVHLLEHACSFSISDLNALNNGSVWILSDIINAVRNLSDPVGGFITAGPNTMEQSHWSHCNIRLILRFDSSEGCK